MLDQCLGHDDMSCAMDRKDNALGLMTHLNSLSDSQSQFCVHFIVSTTMHVAFCVNPMPCPAVLMNWCTNVLLCHWPRDCGTGLFSQKKRILSFLQQGDVHEPTCLSDFLMPELNTFVVDQNREAVLHQQIQ